MNGPATNVEENLSLEGNPMPFVRKTQKVVPGSQPNHKCSRILAGYGTGKSNPERIPGLSCKEE